VILIDPAAIAIPNFATTPETANELLNRIKHFSKVCSANTQIRVFVSDDLEDQLGINAGYSQSIRDYLELMGLEFTFDAKDIANEIGVLQHQATRLGDWEHSFEFDAAGVSFAPELPEGMSPIALLEFTKQNLLLVSVSRERGQRLVLMSPFSDPTMLKFGVETQELVVRDRAGEHAYPTHSGFALAVDRLRSVVSLDIAHDLWACAASADELSVAIAIGALAMLKDGGEGPEVMPEQFSVGTGFLESIRRNQAAGAGSFANVVAETCFALAAGMFKGKDRICGKKTAEARASDGAEGRRTHVTKSAIGLRLMYWRAKSGIEFANVGPKNELYISPGVSDKTCLCCVYKLGKEFSA